MITQAQKIKIIETLEDAPELIEGSYRKEIGSDTYYYCATGWLAFKAGFKFNMEHGLFSGLPEFIEESYGLSRNERVDIYLANDQCSLKINRKLHVLEFIGGMSTTDDNIRTS